MMNRDQELKAAIEQQNYEAFQQIIGEILGTDFSKQSTNPQSGGQQSQLAGLGSMLGG